MNYLSVENISKSFGTNHLFKDISFGLLKGQKIGLIAKNGAGKSTLLKIIAGLETPEDGKITFRKGINIGFLNQNENYSGFDNIKQFIYLSEENPLLKNIYEYNQLLSEQPNSDKISSLYEEISIQNGWEKIQLINKVLSSLGFDDISKEIKNFSGGEKKRLSLAKVLIKEADLVILDEPTNHLDIEMIEWLEQYLSDGNLTLLLVTHDRYFLESICDEILELSRQNMYKYKGNFSYYLEKKAEREQVEKQTIHKAKSLMSKELEWMRRQPKARGTKSKSRINSFYNLKEIAKQKIENPLLEIPIKPQRLGSKILEFHNISKSFSEKKIIENLTYNFKTNEKLGLVGNNGTGKSTLLNMIMGIDNPDKGKIVIGDTVTIGYYNQKGMKINQDKKVIDIIKDIAEFIPLEKGKILSASQMLELFLFDKEKHYQYAYKLSGGEQKRLYLLTILMENPNFLILDEPTNDLDIDTLVILENYLQSYNGCVITVSHDRYFLDKVCEHIWVLNGDGTYKDIIGNYTMYKQEVKQLAKQKQSNNKVKHDNINTYQSRKEFNKLEKQINQLEEKKIKLHNQMAEAVSDNEMLIELSQEVEKIESEIEDKTLRWMEIGEILD